MIVVVVVVEGQEKVVFTLALDQVQAPKVIFAGRSAQVTFALLGEKTRVAPAPGVKLQDVVPNAYGGTR